VHGTINFGIKKPSHKPKKGENIKDAHFFEEISSKELKNKRWMDK
jgi:hypothetical protein